MKGFKEKKLVRSHHKKAPAVAQRKLGNETVHANEEMLAKVSGPEVKHISPRQLPGVSGPGGIAIITGPGQLPIVSDLDQVKVLVEAPAAVHPLKEGTATDTAAAGGVEVSGPEINFADRKNADKNKGNK